MTDKSTLMKYAINYLSKYSSSKANLKKILQNKIRKLSNDKREKYLLYTLIEEIILKLENNDIINDLNYSLSKMRNFIFQGKSKAYIKSYLFQKGVEKDIILETLENFNINNPEWEIESAKTFARKKNLLKDSEDREKKLSKMARAGFNYQISKKILDEI